jgi:hypothetical protein
MWSQLAYEPRSVPPPVRTYRNKYIDRDALFAYRLTGKTVQECADHFGVSHTYIAKHYPDLPTVKLARHYVAAEVDIATLRKLRTVQSKTISEIAAIMGHSDWQIRDRVKQHGIERGPINRSRRNSYPVQVHTRMTEAQRDCLCRLGGAAWLRKLLDEKMRGKV